MNATDSMKLFKVSAPTTEADWAKLIEMRVEMVSPFFDQMTLYQLGEMRFPYQWERGLGVSYLAIRTLNWSKKQLFTRETQGIFVLGVPEFLSEPETFSDGKRGTFSLRGITRKREWISARIDFSLKAGEFSGHWDTVVPEPVLIEQSSLDLLSRSLQRKSFWEMIGKTVELWHNRVSERCKELTELRTIVESESLFMNACK